MYLSDVFLTLCGLTGIPCPSAVEGKDFSGLLADPNAEIRDTIYAAYSDRIRAVKNARYKLIEYRTQSVASVAYPLPSQSSFDTKYRAVTQLFDLKNDPFEMVNLATQPQLRQTVSALREEMFQFRSEWDELQHPCGKAFWSLF